MSITPWENVLILRNPSGRSKPYAIRSTWDAATFLLDHWPAARDATYRRAVITCLSAMKGETTHEAAAAALTVAAMAALFIVEREEALEFDISLASLESLSRDMGMLEATRHSVRA